MDKLIRGGDDSNALWLFACLFHKLIQLVEIFLGSNSAMSIKIAFNDSPNQGLH